MPEPERTPSEVHNLRRLLLSLSAGFAATVFVVAVLAANTIPITATAQQDAVLTQIAKDGQCSVFTPPPKGYIGGIPVSDEQIEAARGHLLQGQPTAGPSRTPTFPPPPRTIQAPIGVGNEYQNYKH